MSPPENAGGSTARRPPMGVDESIAGLAGTLARNHRLLWTLAILAFLADVLTTLAGLQAGLAEGNPVIAGALSDAGLLGFLAVKGVVLAGAVAVAIGAPRFRGVVPAGIAIPWLLAAAANTLLLLGTL